MDLYVSLSLHAYHTDSTRKLARMHNLSLMRKVEAFLVTHGIYILFIVCFYIFSKDFFSLFQGALWPWICDNFWMADISNQQHYL